MKYSYFINGGEVCINQRKGSRKFQYDCMKKGVEGLRLAADIYL